MRFEKNMGTAILSIALVVMLTVASAIDLKHHRLPNFFTISLLLSGLTIVPAVVGVSNISYADRLLGATLAYGFFALIGEFYFRRTGVEGLGLGDAKLFSASGAWLGWQALPNVLLVAAVLGLLYAVGIKRTANSRGIPFGPMLSVSFACFWLMATYA